MSPRREGNPTPRAPGSTTAQRHARRATSTIVTPTVPSPAGVAPPEVMDGESTAKLSCPWTPAAPAPAMAAGGRGRWRRGGARAERGLVAGMSGMGVVARRQGLRSPGDGCSLAPGDSSVIAAQSPAISELVTSKLLACPASEIRRR